jgi:hypothetical protein
LSPPPGAGLPAGFPAGFAAGGLGFGFCAKAGEAPIIDNDNRAVPHTVTSLRNTE